MSKKSSILDIKGESRSASVVWNGFWIFIQVSFIYKYKVWLCSYWNGHAQCDFQLLCTFGNSCTTGKISAQ